MTGVVDPSPIVQKRIDEEVAPLRVLLQDETDSRTRRAITREIQHRERRICKALAGNNIVW